MIPMQNPSSGNTRQPATGSQRYCEERARSLRRKLAERISIIPRVGDDTDAAGTGRANGKHARTPSVSMLIHMRLGVIADIHGNDVALRAVLNDAEKLAVDNWWALGDLVLFGPRPAEVLELLTALPGIRMLRETPTATS